MGLGSGIRKNPIPDLGSRIQGLKKAPDPGSGSATLAPSFLGVDTYGISVRVLTNNRDLVTSCFLRFFMVNNIFADISMIEILVHQIFSNFSWRKITVISPNFVTGP